MSAEITFTTGFALLDTAFYATGAGDSLETFALFTRIVEYRDSDAPHWWRHDQDWRACAITYFGSGVFDDAVALSEEGHVRYIGDHNPLQEKISGAGVYSEDSKGWGYLADLQQIGDHLYACGYRGQVYKRFAANDWRHIDQGLLQSPETAMKDIDSF